MHAPHVALYLVDLVKQVFLLIGSCNVFADAPGLCRPLWCLIRLCLHIPDLTMFAYICALHMASSTAQETRRF